MMKDMLGREIQVNDTVAFANNSGWLALASVVEVDTKAHSLQVIKRGYKNYPTDKELAFPEDVLVVTNQVDSVMDVSEAGRPEEVKFIQELRKATTQD